MSSDRNRLGGWRNGQPSRGLGGPQGPPESAGIGAPGGIIALVLITLLLVVIAVFGLSKNPGRTLWYFFLGPFSNLYAFGNMLNSAIPLVFGGLGVSVAMRANSFNLGGEGQLYAGALVATLIALALKPLGFAGALTGLAMGAAIPGLAAAFSGLCRAKWNTSELITSFLVSNALILVVDYLVTGPFLDPATNLLSTRKLDESFRLPLILPPSNLSAALFIALAMSLLTGIFLSRTRLGYEIRMTGSNELFARYGGVNTGRITILAMFLSGALYGLGGGLAVYGTYYGTVKGFSSGMGWNGLAVALIARLNPALVVPSAVFFAWIGTGARIAMQNSDITVEIALVVQGAVFFLVTSQVLFDIFKKRRP
jgi:simple sugar transport system permease protein